MKTHHLLLLQVLLMVSAFTLAQQRGFKQVNLEIDGQTTTLYSGSHALLIGVSDYTAGWPKLPGVAKDIQKVKTALEKHDFDVTTVMNPTDRHMEDAFEDFINKYGGNGDARLIFYFAGHGHTIKTSYGEELGYIVPANAPNPNNGTSNFQRKAMEMAQIEIFAKRIQSKHALFLFDACFSGSLFALSRAVPENINWKTSKHVRQFITSGSADETVPDRSIFCSQFTAGINGEADMNHDGYITGTELGEFLQNSVVNYSRNAQHPQYGKIRNPNLDKGDFVFVLNNKPMESIQPKEVVISEPERIIRYGNIELTTEISGRLYMDGTFMQQVTKDTRQTLNNVTTGNHILKIEGDEAWQETISVSENITARTTAKATIRNDIKRQDWEPEMIFVKGGTFTMGCTSEQSDCGNDEKPTHQVTVSDFYIGKYEVTQKQWGDIMGPNPSNFKNCENCPVEMVSWNDVQEFIKKLNEKTGKNYHLPTEAEWEYASRDGASTGSVTTTKYAGGNNIDEVAWYFGNSGNKTHPVGQKKPNALGLYDMSGNVWEWCSDWVGDYNSGSQINPKGPSSGSYCVLRGGCWGHNARNCRVADRNFNNPDFSSLYFGFRLVLAP
nr:SUMF1/EgtB/PvdO family nonheme iron enzyme [Bacteroidota bacterium]